METIATWDRNTVISELNQGRELANELKRKIHPITSNSKESCGLIMEKILSTYDNAIALLNCIALHGNGEGPDPDSTENSPKSEGCDPGFKDQAHQHVSKKRKTLPIWREQLHVCPEKGLDGQRDDGYNWRKYGQKEILGANHPRAYYRCSYQNTQGCLATKYVQKTDKDPSIFDVMYRGQHTCIQERLKEKKENLNIQNTERNKGITNESGLKVDKQELDYEEERLPSFSFPLNPIETVNLEAQFLSEPGNLAGTSFSAPPFLSSAISESFFSPGICQSVQSSEPDFAEIISSPTPLTNYPLVELDFLMDLDNHFFEDSEFFS